MLSEKGADHKYQQILSNLYARANRLSSGRLGILRFAIRRFTLVRGAEAAAATAFYALFSLFPLMLVLIAISSFFLESQQVQEQVLNLVRLTVPISPELIVTNLQEVLQQRSTVGFIGLIGLAWSATGLLTTITRNINRAWPTATARNFLQSRLIGIGMLVALIALLALSSVATTIVNVLAALEGPFSGKTSPFNLAIVPWITRILEFVFGLLIFMGLYRWVPNTKVLWRAAFWAGLIASISWQITTSAFALYVRSGLAQYKLIYGSLGTIVALMFWIYLNFLIIFFCAHLSAAIVNYKEKKEATDKA
jgi:membrane protein